MSTFIYKLVVAGDGSVGKSTLIQRIVTGKFHDQIPMTIGVDFYTHTLPVPPDHYTLQFWDLGGQDRFQILHSCYIVGAKAGIVVYDITRYSSIEHLPHWVALLRDKDPTLPILLLGTKADLADPTLVTTFLTDPYFDQFTPIAHLAISARTGNGISDTLTTLITRLRTCSPNTARPLRSPSSSTSL